MLGALARSLAGSRPENLNAVPVVGVRSLAGYAIMITTAEVEDEVYQWKEPT